MQRQNRRIVVLLNILFELGILLAAYELAMFVRFTLMDGILNEEITSSLSWRLILLYCAATVCVYWMAHLYVPVYYITLRTELLRVAVINMTGLIVLGFALYLFRINNFSRLMLVLFGVFGTTLIWIERIIFHAIVRKHILLGDRRRHVILVGGGRLAQQYCRDVSNNPHLGLVVDGYVGVKGSKGVGRHLGKVERIGSVLERYTPDQVIVALEPEETGYIKAVLEAVEKEGFPVSMVPFYSEFYPSHPTFESFGRTKLVNLRATPLDNIALAALKRAVDFVGSAVLILLLSPLMIVTAIGVKISSPGPVFFRQERIGKNKKQFTMLKFRSMRINSEEATGWSTEKDPRRTKFGSFIRKYSIDELPQLFNVFIGDMSLVGPRPEVPYYVYRFKETVPRYLVRQQVRPGMTGWAQVHGLRGDTSIEARVDYDIWYIENWSLWLDIRILFLTLLGGFINNEELVISNE